jgi:serine protease AprX
MLQIKIIARPLYTAARLVILLGLLAGTIAIRPGEQVVQASAWQTKVDSWVLETADQGETEFLVFLQEQADLSGANRLHTKQEKGQYVYQQLTRLAERTQKPVLDALRALAAESPGSLEYQPFWIANMIWVRGDSQTVQALARRGDVAHLYANPKVALDAPLPSPSPILPTTTDEIIVEDSIQKIHAPELWALGYNGQGVVVGGQDTGYDWTHHALRDKYRGWNGLTANHNYNWHDAIHSGGGVCGPDSPVPCDDDYHGTHTLGTMVGEGVDGEGNFRQFGVAPGAKWIGCRNMNQGFGTPTSYSECFQWFIAPTDLNGQNPRPDLAPDIINNSWHCPVSEGCTDPNVLLTVVNNVRAAGILTVQSAGNSGPACSTISSPAGIYDASFTVGATYIDDLIVEFSSRGPVTVDGSNRLKPDVTAPGFFIFSSTPDDSYRILSGTSMAAPHVAGMAALLLSARPDLAGQVDQIEALIRDGARPLTTSQICGGVSGSQVPNNTYGWGRIDALASIRKALLKLQKWPSSLLYDPGGLITYSLEVTNQNSLEPVHNVRISDTLPANTIFINASLPYLLTGELITWGFPQLDPGQSQTVELVVQIPLDAYGPIANLDYAASADEAPPISGPPVWIFSEPSIFYPFIPVPTR